MLRSLSVTLAISAAMLLAGSSGSTTTAAAGRVGKIAPVAGPMSPVHRAACGSADEHCPDGAYWTCGPYGQRCWCTPC
ncbi:MAG: hypothetical protein JO305_04165 [Alphaproteobacteria bacterium]|nr:hypothetical protein [Alphaproteobacteria bacterium]